MKILFVGRAKAGGNVGPILYSQGKSLEKLGCVVDYFAIQDAGFKGYWQNVSKLKHYIKETNPEIIHAHYSLTGFVASLSTKKPVVVSLMGSFPKKNWRFYMVQFFTSFFWEKVIVKSQKTANQLNRKNLNIIPNGVDLELFSLTNKEDIRKTMGLNLKKKYILFAADPQRVVKNHSLAIDAVTLLNNHNVELLTIYNVPHKTMVDYMIASDMLLLTSLSEGSPNVIKEAMACNLPIVTTDVGDVRILLNELGGTFIANTFDANEIMHLIIKALECNETQGRIQLEKLNLDNLSVAEKLIALYKEIKTN